MEDPTSFLVPPGEPDDSVTKGFANPLDLFNYLSPSAWLNEAINALTGFDVFGWMTDWLSGDWAALWRGQASAVTGQPVLRRILAYQLRQLLL